MAYFSLPKPFTLDKVMNPHRAAADAVDWRATQRDGHWKRSKQDADAAMCARTLVDTYTHRSVAQLLVRDACAFCDFMQCSLTSSFPRMKSLTRGVCSDACRAGEGLKALLCALVASSQLAIGIAPHGPLAPV
jgi:hypothetical protein